MTQKGAVEGLTPQMADYDRLAEQVDWRPYVMFFQRPNFSSPSVTTDALGFRPSVGASGERFSPAEGPTGAANLLVGNSVAFGVGATSDAQSISSHLCTRTGAPWLNFCGRAYGAVQELLLFQSYRYRLGPVNRVVLCTGLNDLYLYYAPKVFDETFGVFFFSDAFYRGMGEAARLRTSNKRSLLSAVLRPWFGDRIDYANVPLRQLPREILCAGRSEQRSSVNDTDFEAIVAERRPGRDSIIDHLGRTLELWSHLARGMQFRLTYVLQPMLPWLSRELSVEEQQLVATHDTDSGRWHQILRAVLDREHHTWYAGRLSELCRRHDIEFIDLNDEQFPDKQWLFVDRIHMNDVGQKLTADLIAGRLSA
jgi:hypothetical protein